MSSGHDSFSREPHDRVSAPATSRAYDLSIATHYETLGVSPDASAEQIRTAYVARARRRHPDVAPAAAQVGVRSAESDPSMAELNQAYHVLRRPHTRVEYDRSLRAPVTSVGSDPDETMDAVTFEGDLTPSSPGARLAGRVLTPGGPARMPWRLMAVTAVVGSAVVLVSASLADAPADEVPDGILRVGSCVVIEANGDAREVACADAGNQVVRLVLPTGSQCPPAYATHRDRLGLGTACVEQVE